MNNILHKRYLVFLITVNVIVGYSQEPINFGCGNNEFNQYSYSASFEEVSEEFIIPLNFYLLNNDINIDTIFPAIERERDSLELIFKNIEFVFEICEIDYLETGLNGNLNLDSDIDFLDRLDQTRLNVIVVKGLERSIDDEIKQLCGYALIDPLYQVVFLRLSCFRLDASILSHELGHIFSLRHTHSHYRGQEYVQRTNCEDVSDTFCDTPADPTLNYLTVNSDCEYIGGEKDLWGDAYVPDTRNIMSYSRSKCRNHFSEEQLSEMKMFAGNVFSDKFETCSQSSNTSYINNGLILSPNPSFFQVSFSGHDLINDNTPMIQFADLTGKVVLESDKWENIDISFMNNGLYVVLVFDSDGHLLFISKLIKV